MRTARLVPGLLLLAAAPLAAMDSHIVGPRALGMGGAGTAAADDHTAAYWNPAMFGFFSRTGEDGERLPADPNFIGRKDWGVGLADVGLGVDVRGELADWVEQLADVDLSRLGDLGGASGTPDDLRTAMVALDMLNRFTPSRDNVALTANVGVLDTRILKVGIGFRQFAEGVVSVADLDRTSIGFGTDSLASITADINSAPAPDGYTPAHVPTLITGANAATLAAALGGGAAADEAVRRLDYASAQAGLSQADVDSLIAGGSGLLIAAINASTFLSADSIENNQTAVFTAGYTVAEVPLTIGWAVNDHLAIGGNLKLMVGRVAGAKMRLLAEVDDIASLLQDSFEDAEQTVTAGVDLGVALRCSWAQVGLTGRNLNAPVLEGGTFLDADGQPFTVDDVELSPQVALGVALYPFETVCLTADLDLTENRTVIATTSGRTLAPGIDRRLEVEFASQRLALGAEWNLARFLALRGGLSRDLVDGDAGTMLHGGVGLNLWAVRFDLAGAISTETVTVDGEDYPRAFNLGAGLTIDF